MRPKDAAKAAAKAAVKRWKEFWADAAVAELTVKRQEEFFAWLKQCLSEGTVARVVGVGRAAINRAHRRQEIASPPLILPYKAPQVRRERVLTLEEMGKLWAAGTHHEHWRRYLWLAVGTAARPEAILQLTGAQLDFKAKVIHLARPGVDYSKKRRPTIPMAATVASELKKWKTDGVLVTWDGKPLARARETFKHLSTAAGVASTAYNIRHTVATELARHGVEPWQLAGFLGHLALGSRTTARYAHHDRTTWLRRRRRSMPT
jgi:integrase